MPGGVSIRSRLAYPTIALLLGISIAGVAKGDILTVLTPALLIAVYAVGRGGSFLRTAILHGILTALSSSDLYTAMLSATCSALVVLELLSRPGERRAMESIVVAASYTPLYIYSTTSLFNGVAAALAILGRYLTSYSTVSTARSRIRREVYETMPSAAVEVVLELEAGRPLNWRVYLDGREVRRVDGVERQSIGIELVESFLGEHHHTLSVVAGDPWGFYRRRVLQVGIVVRVVPRAGELLKHAERLLARYASIITPPEIYRALFTPAIVPSRAVAVLGGSPGVGVVSLGAAEIGLEGGLGEGRGSGEVAVAKPVSMDRGIGLGTDLYTKDGEMQHHLEVLWLPYLRLRNIVTELIGALSSYGEFTGVRDYYPGDSPRRIHWKKSVSLNRLVVKEYSGLSGDVGRGSTPYILIADWISTSPADLDRVVSTTLESLLTIPPTVDCLLVLTTVAGNTYLIRGKAIDVLTTLYVLVKEETPLPYYNYRLEKRVSASYLMEGVRSPILRQLRSYYEALASGILKMLSNNGIPPGSSIAVIHSPPTSAKYSIVSFHLSGGGYFISIARASRVGESR